MDEILTLKAGKSFGELALINNRPRAATIICKEDCHFITINKKSFNHAISKVMQKTIQESVDFFKNISFFQGWTKKSLMSFLLHSVEQKKA